MQTTKPADDWGVGHRSDEVGLAVASSLGVDVVGVRRQRPPHEALLVLSSSSYPFAAAPLVVARREAHAHRRPLLGAYLTHISLLFLLASRRARRRHSSRRVVGDDGEEEEDSRQQQQRQRQGGPPWCRCWWRRHVCKTATNLQACCCSFGVSGVADI